jgi:hypothetical protein
MFGSPVVVLLVNAVGRYLLHSFQRLKCTSSVSCSSNALYTRSINTLIRRRVCRMILGTSVKFA